MTLSRLGFIIAVTVLAAAPGQTAPRLHPALSADPAIDQANPAAMQAFVLPVDGGAMNAVLYAAAGSTPHPTLLLLHGFPGNEQNLDLAQAARRTGWNVLTLHYRGSWGSPGSFSFTHAAEDTHSALAFLRSPEAVARFHIDPSRIAVAGHSMGGFMAADVAADDPHVIGMFLIDPWSPAETAASLSTPAGRADWEEEAKGDLPPLAGTSLAALTEEIVAHAARFDLGRRIAAYGARPLAITAAERGLADTARAVLPAAKGDQAEVSLAIWPTDHSLSDHRIALTARLLGWLDQVASRPR